MPTMACLSLVRDALLSNSVRQMCREPGGCISVGQSEDKLKLAPKLIDASHQGTVIGRGDLKCLSTKKRKS